MDEKRDKEPPHPDQDARPPDAGVLPSAEPDAELAPAYAAWRLDRMEGRR